ncbi:hypothetical protein ASZ90_015462 [hydrocarbon metagenome]|uniref:Uncharacterized protein n=1 Tax=hydrocarbon metagenome TaxID=938273 RepID=A0A0W8F1Y9_9ZZZZ
MAIICVTAEFRVINHCFEFIWLIVCINSMKILHGDEDSLNNSIISVHFKIYDHWKAF